MMKEHPIFLNKFHEVTSVFYIKQMSSFDDDDILSFSSILYQENAITLTA